MGDSTEGELMMSTIQKAELLPERAGDRFSYILDIVKIRHSEKGDKTSLFCILKKELPCCFPEGMPYTTFQSYFFRSTPPFGTIDKTVDFLDREYGFSKSETQLNRLKLFWSFGEPIKNYSSETFLSPGERLRCILNHCGVNSSARGAKTWFFRLLQKELPEFFENTPKPTVMAWFNKNIPHAKKINSIINMLDMNFQINDCNDLSAITSWWALGGSIPFDPKLCRLRHQDHQGTFSEPEACSVIDLKGLVASEFDDYLTCQSFITIASDKIIDLHVNEKIKVLSKVIEEYKKIQIDRRGTIAAKIEMITKAQQILARYTRG